MTPRVPLSGHPNLNLPIQNPAAFTTILTTLHKHMAHHSTLPNTAIHIHLQLHQTDVGDTYNMMELHSML